MQRTQGGARLVKIREHESSIFIEWTGEDDGEKKFLHFLCLSLPLRNKDVE